MQPITSSHYQLLGRMHLLAMLPLFAALAAAVVLVALACG